MNAIQEYFFFIYLKFTSWHLRYRNTYDTLSVPCSMVHTLTAACKFARLSSNVCATRFNFIAATIGCVTAVM